MTIHLQLVTRHCQPGDYPHLGPGGCPNHYDLLVMLGDHTKADLVFQNWGFIFLIGMEMLWQCVERCFCIEVADWSGGERVCVSHYMKDNVMKHLEVCHPNWTREEDYLSLVGK